MMTENEYRERKRIYLEQVGDVMRFLAEKQLTYARVRNVLETALECVNNAIAEELRHLPMAVEFDVVERNATKLTTSRLLLCGEQD